MTFVQAVPSSLTPLYSFLPQLASVSLRPSGSVFLLSLLANDFIALLSIAKSFPKSGNNLYSSSTSLSNILFISSSLSNSFLKNLEYTQSGGTAFSPTP
jgi:hypothetical protein